MSQTNWEADKMLDVYIYDYLVKRNLHASARAFQAEGNVSRDPVAIDAPAGFLFEWWSVFWDIFIARTDLKHSEAAASYIESQQNKAREMQKQQEQEHQKSQQHQQMQMQHSIQRHAQQQQHRVGIQLASGSTSGPVSNDSLTAANASATNIYERLKPPLQRETLNDAAIRQKLGGNVSQFLDPSHASLLKGSVATTGGLSTGQTLLGTSSGLLSNLQQVQARNQQLSASTQDMKNNINPLMSSRVSGESLIGGSSQGGGNLTLKGWPLAGLDQLRSGLLQQNALMQSMHSFNQLPAQQNSAAQSLSDMENRRLSILLNNQNMSLGKEGPIPDILLKQQVQKSNQLPQQYSQHPLSSQQSEQQGKMVGSGSTIADGSISGAFHGNNQVTKNQNGRKRKQASSSGPTNSSGTANTTGPSASSPSTPSTHTAGDVMSVPTLQQNVPSSKSLLVFGSDSLGSLTSAQNQMADMDRLIIDGSFGDNVDSFLSPDDVDPGDGVAHQQDVGKGFSLKELNPIMASTHRVECCDFSSDGKLLATGGYDSKVSLWCTESFNLRSTLEEHSQEITDVRFSPSMSRVATSSADKTVRIWDADNPGYSLRTFTGHLSAVTSLDFHPSKEDLICSCDNNSEIRYWSIKNGSCAGVFKGGATQIRFQPGLGSLLAAAVDNLISILDVESHICRFKLQGHKNLVHSMCWDFSGKYLASVSDESVRVWTFGSSVKAECIHELMASGNKFNTCVFHPSYPWLIIGGYETLELWNFREDKTTTLHAHDKLVTSLAASKVTGLVASASHDRRVKFWK